MKLGSLGAGVAAWAGAVLSSLCCLLPLTVIVVGLGSGAFMAVTMQYRWILIPTGLELVYRRALGSPKSRGTRVYPTKLTEPRLGCSPPGRRQERRKASGGTWRDRPCRTNCRKLVAFHKRSILYASSQRPQN
jgi:hypothetical protein